MYRADGFTIQRAGRVEEIGQPAWEAMGEGIPFASYRWTRFGEAAMTDCHSTHILLHFDNKPVARVSFWRVDAEPLALPAVMRAPLAAYLRKRPLLICRAPLANWTGLFLPEDPSLRNMAREVFLAEGLRLLAEQRGSYLLFDFLDAPDLEWPADVNVVTVSDPGTRLKIRWRTFDEYLASMDKRGRQHYKRILRSAPDMRLSRHETIVNVDEALALIRNVERRHGAAANPWARGLLENAAKIGGIWQEVRQKDRLVACGMLLEDNGVMIATALGLAENVHFAYFLLVYAALEEAIERGARVLRLGSGAYDVKRRLGFELESNNHTAVAARSPMLRRVAKWMT